MTTTYSLVYIEDNEANLRLVQRIIERRGDVEFLCAVDPTKGLELVSEKQPDLVLLDLNLPGMSGFDVLERIRSNLETAHIPVFAISANAMNTDIQKGMKAGFNSYIAKPFDIQELLDAISEVFD